MLDQAAIRRLIPHQGRMCLLESVERWTATEILCHAISHHDLDHPLRRHGHLSTLCGVEYGLQAMAVHGALIGGAPQPPGFLSSLRDLRLHRPDFDGVGERLGIRAELRFAAATGFVYTFALADGAMLLIEGQAAIIIPRDGGGTS